MLTPDGDIPLIPFNKDRKKNHKNQRRKKGMNLGIKKAKKIKIFLKYFFPIPLFVHPCISEFIFLIIKERRIYEFHTTRTINIKNLKGSIMSIKNKLLFNFDFFRNWKILLKWKNLKPDYHIPTLSELLPLLTDNRKIEGVIFDIDQTITEYGSMMIPDENLDAIREIKKVYASCIISNFQKTPKSLERVKKISRITGLEVIYSDKKKPDPAPFKAALNYLEKENSTTVMVGDRLLTDISGANNAGIISVLIKPINPSRDPLVVKIARFFEKIIIRLQGKNNE